MTQDEIIDKDFVLKMAKQAGFHLNMWQLSFGCKAAGTLDELKAFAKLVAQHERERIKQANAPEIERVNAHIKQLEDAVLAEREACAKVCDDHCGWTPRMIGSTIRARGQA